MLGNMKMRWGARPMGATADGFAVVRMSPPLHLHARSPGEQATRPCCMHGHFARVLAAAYTAMYGTLFDCVGRESRRTSSHRARGTVATGAAPGHSAGGG